MKGFVFTEFTQMVEDTFGLKMLDEIIMEAKVGSGGVYTAVGNYNHEELVKMVSVLSEKTHSSVPSLLQGYGRHMFSVFSKKFAHLFTGLDSSFTFLENLDSYIHVEVSKLYPDAGLPKFTFERISEKEIEMVYYSTRRMSDFALGLIYGCAEYFGEQIQVKTKDLSEGRGEHVQINIIKI